LTQFSVCVPLSSSPAASLFLPESNNMSFGALVGSLLFSLDSTIVVAPGLAAGLVIDSFELGPELGASLSRSP